MVVPVVCNPHGLWQKATVWLVINSEFSYSPRHMIFNTKGTLFISTKWRHNECFTNALKGFEDINYATQHPSETGE